MPQTSGRIKTNGVLNSLSRQGGRATGGGTLAVTVDASSIDAALGKISALKNAIGALGQGGGSTGGGPSSGGRGALRVASEADAQASRYAGILACRCGQRPCRAGRPDGRQAAGRPRVPG